MSDNLVHEICTALPGAEPTEPWGPGVVAWKICGKVFACTSDDKFAVTVKTPDVDTAQFLIDMGVATKAPYFHRSWVRLSWESDPDELRHRLLLSYDIVRASLTKKLQSTLPPRAD